MDTLEAPIAEEGGSFGHKLIFFVPAVLASFYLVDPAISCHNPTVRAQAAIVSGPVGINDIDLSPIVTTGIRYCAICPVFCLRPTTVKIFHVGKFCEATAIRTNKYQGIGKETDPARLSEDKLSGINEGLVLVIQKCTVNALLGQNSRFLAAVCGTLEPAFDIFCEVLKQLFLDCRRRGRNGRGHGDGDATPESALISEERTGGIGCRNLSSRSLHFS